MFHITADREKPNWFAIMRKFRNAPDTAMTLHFQEQQDDIQKYTGIIYLAGKRNGMTVRVQFRTNKSLIVLKQHVRKTIK